MFKVRNKQSWNDHYSIAKVNTRKAWHSDNIEGYKLFSNSFRKITDKDDYEIVLKNKKVDSEKEDGDDEEKEDGESHKVRKSIIEAEEERVTDWENGWSKRETRTGKTFYQNLKLNITQYEKPTDLGRPILPEQKEGCSKEVRLSNLTMVIESRYELNKFIKSLGSFGNLLYLTLESGLFGRVEAELKKLS